MLIAQLQIDWSAASSPWVNWLPQTLGTMLVVITCAVLGCFVVLRRMALIGDALSHAILPGVVVALLVFGWAGTQAADDGWPIWRSIREVFSSMATEKTMPLWLLGGALIAGLVTAVLINVVHRISRTKEDSSIGIAFTSMFALGLILLSNLPRGTHFDLRCFVYGEPLAIRWPDLWMIMGVCPLVLIGVVVLYPRLKLISFDPVVAAAMGVSVVFIHYLLMGMLASTIVAGLKSTGVILVVAMVITPASAAYQLTNRLWVMLVLAGLFGAVSAALGMTTAFVINAPTGPVMVLVAAAIFLLAMFFSPSHGWVWDRWRRIKLARHVAAEDVLKAMFRLGSSTSEKWHELVGAETGLGRGRLDRVLARLRREGLVDQTQNDTVLTTVGTKHAEQLVRAHRLWETYLVNEAGVPVEAVHEVAERLEHAHELSEALSDALGQPEKDPHGSAIPGQGSGD